MLPTNPKNSTCKYCPYNRPSVDGLHEDCDPPMGECLLEYGAGAIGCVQTPTNLSPVYPGECWVDAY